jgi:hypothetical protein
MMEELWMLNAESNFVSLWGLAVINFDILCVTVISLTLWLNCMSWRFLYFSSHTQILEAELPKLNSVLLCFNTGYCVRQEQVRQVYRIAQSKSISIQTFVRQYGKTLQNGNSVHDSLQWLQQEYAVHVLWL